MSNSEVFHFLVNIINVFINFPLALKYCENPKLKQIQMVLGIVLLVVFSLILVIQVCVVLSEKHCRKQFISPWLNCSEE